MRKVFVGCAVLLAGCGGGGGGSEPAPTQQALMNAAGVWRGTATWTTGRTETIFAHIGADNAVTLYSAAARTSADPYVFYSAFGSAAVTGDELRGTLNRFTHQTGGEFGDQANPHGRQDGTVSVVLRVTERTSAAGTFRGPGSNGSLALSYDRSLQAVPDAAGRWFYRFDYVSQWDLSGNPLWNTEATDLTVGADGKMDFAVTDGPKNWTKPGGASSYNMPGTLGGSGPALTASATLVSLKYAGIALTEDGGAALRVILKDGDNVRAYRLARSAP